MKTKELIEFLETFDQEEEVTINVCSLDKKNNILESDRFEANQHNFCIDVFSDGVVIEILLTPEFKKILKLKED